MLAVRLNKPQFEYDIHSIVKAFYPAETVKVFEEEQKILNRMGITHPYPYGLKKGLSG